MGAKIRPLIAVLMTFTLLAAACGGSERDDAVAELVAAGFPEAEAGCIYDGVTEAVGDIDRIQDDDVSDDELEEAAAVFARCAGNVVEDSAEPESEEEAAAPAVDPTAVPAAADDSGDATPAPTQAPAPVSDATTPVSALGGPGHWSWDQLCALVVDGELDALFPRSAPIVGERVIDTPTWSQCRFEDPDVEFNLAEPSTVLLLLSAQDRNGIDVPGDVALSGLGPDDGATFRDEWDPGRSDIFVVLGEHALGVSYPIGTPGGRELAEVVAQRWVDAQLGESVTPADAQAAEPPETESATNSAGDLTTLIAQLRADCASGDPDGCDRLYLLAAPGSDDEAFGGSCGDQGFADCTVLLGDANGSFTPTTPPPGTDAGLDELWTDCGGGDPAACEILYFDSDVESIYEYYGQSCGGRSIVVDCELAVNEYTG